MAELESKLGMSLDDLIAAQKQRAPGAKKGAGKKGAAVSMSLPERALQELGVVG